MYLTYEEYNNRERFATNFNCDFESFAKSVFFPEGTIFKVKRLTGGETFAKITCEFAQIHFDIRECDEKGEFVRFGRRMGSVHRTEIAERLYEGDWKTIS